MKKIFLITAFLLFILTVGIASASDNITSSVESFDDSAAPVEISDDDIQIDNRTDLEMEIKFHPEINNDVRYAITYGDRYTDFEELMRITNIHYNLNGNIIIQVDNDTSEQYDISQLSSYEINPYELNDGNHTLTIEYPGDINYKPINKTIKFYIGPITSNIDGTYLTVSASSSAQGTLLININGKEYDRRTLTEMEYREPDNDYEWFGYGYRNYFYNLDTLNMNETYELEIIFNGNCNYYKKIMFQPSYSIDIKKLREHYFNNILFNIPIAYLNYTTVTIDGKEHSFNQFDEVLFYD